MTKTIDNLEPRHPHKFRIQVILRGTAIATLADKALQHFGNEKAVLEHIENYQDGDAFKDNEDKPENTIKEQISDTNKQCKPTEKARIAENEDGQGDTVGGDDNVVKQEELPNNGNTNVGGGDVGNNRTFEITLVHSLIPTYNLILQVTLWLYMDDIACNSLLIVLSTVFL